MSTMDERAKRQSIIDACLRMNALGINQGTSGNISLRHDAGMLVTPTSVPYEAMQPEQIVFMGFDGSFDLSQRPSSEWRFHLDILKARPEVNAVVHAHPPYATTLAIMGREIPAVHYMVAVAGGDSIRCAPYATFGTEELSRHAVSALKDRFACLLAHHGMIAIGPSLSKSKRSHGSTMAASRSGRRHCCQRRRSTMFSAGWRDMVPRKSKPAGTSVLTLLRDKPRFRHQRLVERVVFLEEFQHVVAGEEDRL
jgi:L-fuculose-phosphate aldolase